MLRSLLGITLTICSIATASKNFPPSMQDADIDKTHLLPNFDILGESFKRIEIWGDNRRLDKIDIELTRRFETEIDEFIDKEQLERKNDEN